MMGTTVSNLRTVMVIVLPTCLLKHPDRKNRETSKPLLLEEIVLDSDEGGEDKGTWAVVVEGTGTKQ